MPTIGNLKKNKQLGMAHGTACAILKKSILFKLLKESNKNICYRCNKKITKIETLSIDHKRPWLDSSNPFKVFFDLKNIAFSHLRCNSQAGRRSEKIIYPKGMIWCWRCRRFKKIKEFSEYAQKNRGKDCRKCNTKYRQDYRNRTGKR